MLGDGIGDNDDDGDEETFTEVLDRIGNAAVARGLTPEILESILNAPDDD